MIVGILYTMICNEIKRIEHCRLVVYCGSITDYDFCINLYKSIMIIIDEILFLDFKKKKRKGKN